MRNGREARTLVTLDILAARHKVLLDHLLAACAQEHDLQALRSVLSVQCTSDEGLLAALSVVVNALSVVQQNIAGIIRRADELLQAIHDSAGMLRQHAENNEALADELAAEGGAASVAAAKQRLWLIEESLACRIDASLAALKEKLVVN